MKIFLLIINLFFAIGLMAQKKTTQAQLNKMKQHQASEVQKQMKDAMKEIEALETEDPESAKLAKQLLEQMQQKSKPAAPVKEQPVPKLASPIIPIPLKSPIATPTEAQATDRLLWYRGKKLNDSMLVTKKGTLILYSSKKNKVVVQPKPRKDPFDKIINELLKTEERKNEFISQASQMENSFFYYPAIVNTLKEYSALAERYKRILKNTIDLPALNISMPAIPKTSKGGPSVMEEPPADLPTQLLEAYNKVMALQQAAPGLDFPLPPSKEYDLCFDCNFEEQQTNYDRAKKKWDSLFLAYENDLTEQAVAVQRMLDLMFDPAEAQRMDKIHADMNGVMAFAFQRAEKKLNLLVEPGSHVNEPTGNAKLDEMQEYYNKSKDLQDRQAQLSKLAVNPQLLFLFDAHNQDGTLIDGTTNAARSLDKRLKITRGIVNIRVVHAPADEGTKSRRKPLQKQ